MNNISHRLEQTIAKAFRASRAPDPRRDWSALVLFIGVLLLALFVVAAYVYVGARSGFLYAPQTPQNDTSGHVSSEAIADLVSAFEMRKVNHEAGNTRRPQVVDPR